jgi:iron complex outermembrane receptor protein
MSATSFSNRPGKEFDPPRPRRPFIRRILAANLLFFFFLAGGLVEMCWADAQQIDQTSSGPLTQLSLEQLGNVEVTTASKEPEQLRRTPSAIYVITQEDIRRSGATNIPDLLRLVPGVEVARIDSNKWSLGVRGFTGRLSRSVLVLIDGRSVYTPLFAGVYWEVQDTLLEDIERIEVVRGPGGTIWGANAVNGIINIITKKASDTHGMIVSAGGGNVDQGVVNFRLGGGNNKNLDYRIYGKGFNRGPQFHFDGREFDDWRMGQGGFRTDWNLRDGETLTIQGDLYKGGAGQKVGITTYSSPSATTVDQNSDLEGGNLLGRWQRALGTGSDIQLQAYYDRTNREDATFAEARNTFDVDFIHHLTLRRKQDFIWGLGARFSSGNVTQLVPTVIFTPNQYTDKLYSAFVQDEIPIVENRLSLTIGSKFLHYSYSGFDIEPDARLLWTPSTQHSAWLAVTRAVRTPSRIEEDLQLTALLRPSPPTFFRVAGDRGFSSEHLIGYEAGYRGLMRPNLYLDIAAFHNSYNHLLSVEPGTPFTETSPSPSHLVLPLSFRNGLLGSTSGAEIESDWTPMRWLRLKGSYSYLHIDLKDAAGSLDASTATSTENSSPHHQVVIQSFLELPRNLELDLTYRYVSALPAQLVGQYSTGDARFGWRIGEGFELSLAGQNLLQPHHAEYGGDPGGLVGIKRSVYAKVTWRR